MDINAPALVGDISRRRLCPMPKITDRGLTSVILSEAKDLTRQKNVRRPDSSLRSEEFGVSEPCIRLFPRQMPGHITRLRSATTPPNHFILS